MSIHFSVSFFLFTERPNNIDMKITICTDAISAQNGDMETKMATHAFGSSRILRNGCNHNQGMASTSLSRSRKLDRQTFKVRGSVTTVYNQITAGTGTKILH